METQNGEEKVPFIDAEETEPNPPEYSEQSYPREQFIIRPPPITDGPKDYLVQAILVTLFCCWPIGIVAIFKALEVQRASRAGNRELAMVSSVAARKMVRISLIVGIIMNITAVVIWTSYIGFVISHANNLALNQWQTSNLETPSWY